MAKNRRKQYEVKQNTIQANSVKRLAHIIKQGISYDNILLALANRLSVTKTTEDSTESILEYIIPLSSYTLKYAFTHVGGNIGNFPILKKQTITLDIARRCGKNIIKEGSIKISYLRGGARMNQG